MIRIEIPLKVDKKYGMNAIYAGIHWTKRQAQAKEIHELMYYSMLAQKVPKKLFERPVSITIYYNTNLDLDNTAYLRKMLIDGLKGYLIENDDKRYVKELIDRFHSENNITIEVREFNEQSY